MGRQPPVRGPDAAREGLATGPRLPPAAPAAAAAARRNFSLLPLHLCKLVNCGLDTCKGSCVGYLTNPMESANIRFDIYRKVPKDLTQPTFTGAIISVCCCFFILFLFLSELTGFIATEVVNELYVDDPDKDSGGKIEVNLNISLPNLHCELIGLDIQDEMGRHEVGHIDNSMKIPLNNGDGCRFEGHFSINKVPGNFHVSTHSATAQPQNPDMTHVIHKLSFGDKLQVQNIHGAFNALEGADKLSSNPLASHDYILKIVPTVYEDMSGKQRYSYQYTVANKEYVAYSHTGRIIPAIWFRYDLSPITVKYTERRQPLYRFITTICAIIGGTFTVAGILDSCIFTASEAWKKIQLGKMQ
ncbi:endoplasmic reticulum-Golgi intermediate compartment protein 1 [Sceloporus undulatus]|uniref:endoplasmic reticulum-Golgi intermediate compartment protein 1 n=1 Tax=Sceloporus undulatus TaxID=8520 RepID=UPI001C4C2469|nr:endoplasmic reticulum-Golgi intermediate compartment protein 1 [Sceloporus undulatus]